MFAIAFSDFFYEATLLALGIITVLVNVKLRKLDNKLSTNHGKEPFEYLEMIADVKDDLLAMRMDGLESKGLMVDLAVQLQEHTAQDAENFAELKARIADVTQESPHDHD